MHAISSYHGNRPTNKHTQTWPITIQYAAKLSAQCNEYNTLVFFGDNFLDQLEESLPITWQVLSTKPEELRLLGPTEHEKKHKTTHTNKVALYF